MDWTSDSIKMGTLLWTFLLHICLSRAMAEDTLDALPTVRYQQLGHINLGILGNVYGTGPVICNQEEISITGIQYLLAAIRGVGLVNNDTNILGNITLGLIALEDCNTGVGGVGQALKMIAGSSKKLDLVGLQPISESGLNIVGVLGALTSSGSIAVANLLNLFDITMISPTATSDDLSDRFKYPNFFRMVPPDSFQAKVMVDLLVHFNWSYASVVHAENAYGYGGLKFIRRHAKRQGICIADSFPLSDDFDDNDYEDTVHRLNRTRNSRVVPVFAYSSQIRKLLLAATRLGADVFIWILSEAAYAGTVAGVEDVTQGTFLVDWHIPRNDGFQDFIETATLRDYPGEPYISSPWQRHSDKCDKAPQLSAACQNVQLGGLDVFYYVSASLLTTESVLVYGRALDMLIRDNCPQALVNAEELDGCVDTGMLKTYLYNVIFPTSSGPKEFDDDGGMYLDFRLRQVQGKSVPQVGVWKYSTSLIEWREDWEEWESVPESVCAKPCEAGEFYIKGELPCCWECYRCRNNEIVTGNLSACETCPKLTWPSNDTFEDCLPIDPSFLTWSDLYGSGLMSLAGAGFLLTMITIFVVFKNRHRRVIKGATWEMITIILLGVLMIFADIPIFIARPTEVICICGRVFFSLSCTLVFAPLVLKTSRVYLVFRASEKLTRVSGIARARSQYALMVFVILAQVRIVTSST